MEYLKLSTTMADIKDKNVKPKEMISTDHLYIKLLLTILLKI